MHARSNASALLSCLPKVWVMAGLAACSLFASSPAGAAGTWRSSIPEDKLRDISDCALTLMAFGVLPDVTTSSLSIKRDPSGDDAIWQSTLGGGFTVSKGFPLYLEGTLGYSRYDPKFLISNGQEERFTPLKWNTFVATGGIGWDFPLTGDNELKLRPIFNFTLGRVATDAKIAQDIINARFDRALDAVDGGTMNAYGLGGAVMLDYEH